jgi:hypothetical protein
MTKKYLAVALFTALLTGVVETSSALELSQYNKLDTVSRDSEVTDSLITLCLWCAYHHRWRIVC